MGEVYKFGDGEEGSRKLTPKEVKALRRVESSEPTIRKISSVTDLDVARFKGNLDEIIAFTGLAEQPKRIKKLRDLIKRIRWGLSSEEENSKFQAEYATHRARFRKFYLDPLLIFFGSTPGSPHFEDIQRLPLPERKAWIDELEYRLNCWEEYNKRKKSKKKK